MNNSDPITPISFEEQLEKVHESVLNDQHVDAPDDDRFDSARRVFSLIEKVRRAEAVDSSDTRPDAAFPTTEDRGHHAPGIPNSAGVSAGEKNLIGRFEIIRQLGTGGAGLVFLARDPQLDRHVALKIPRPETILTPSTRQRFLREARAVALLSHPNIVPVFEIGELGSICYIVSQFVDGVTLSEEIRARQQPFESTEAANLVRQLADAIEHAHTRGVLHRDLKPSNVLFQKTGAAENCAKEAPISPQKSKPMVTDFGLAKLDSDDLATTRAGDILGTPIFMSPEQARGEPDVGPSSDIYGLGTILYRLLTNSNAFEKPTLTATLRAIQESEPVPPRRLNPDVPRDLEAICLRCLEKEPAARYPSAHELREDLQRFLDNKPVIARRPSRGELIRRWSRRNPLLAITCSAIGILLISIAAGSTISALQIKELNKELDQEKQQTTRQLLLAYENQAHAHVISGRPGHRLKTLDTVGIAVKILPEVEHDQQDILRLRNEAIAAMALTDIKLDREIDLPHGTARMSPDFKSYVWNDEQYQLCCSDAVTDKIRWSKSFQPRASIHSFFSPGGKFVAALANDSREFYLLNAESGKVLLAIRRIAGITNPVAFSRDERKMVLGQTDTKQDHYLLVYDLAQLDKAPRRIPVPRPMSNLFFAGNDQQVFGYSAASIHRGKLVAVDIESETSEIITTPYQNACAWVLSPDETSVAIGTTSGLTIINRWPIEKENEFHVGRESNDVRYLEISPDQQLMFSKAWGSAFELKDFATGTTLFREWGELPHFRNDGRQFAVTDENKLKVFDIHASHEFTMSNRLLGIILGHTPRVSRDGKWLVTKHEDGMRVWETKSMTVVHHVQGRWGWGADFLEDGRLLGFQEGQLAVWKFPSGNNKKFELEKPQLLAESHPDRGGFVDAADKGSRIAWRTPRNTIKVGDVAQTDEALEIKLRRTYFYATFRLDPAGRTLVVNDGSLRLLDAKSGKPLHDFGSETKANVRADHHFSPDGKWLVSETGSQHRSTNYVLIDVANRKIERTFSFRGYQGGASWSADGKLLAIVRDLETIQLLDATTFSELARLRSPVRNGISDLQFGPDGHDLFALVGNNQIHRWNLKAVQKRLYELGLGWENSQ